MKEQKLTSKIRSKLSGVEGAKSYKLTRQEGLEFISEHIVGPCVSVEQLDSLKLLPVFPFLKVPPKCTVNGWTLDRFKLYNSLFNYYNFYFYDDKSVYCCGLFWLTGGSFNRKIKKIYKAKKEELEKTNA